jgi:hypothetical protein
MMDIQATINAMSDVMRDTRTKYHLTLGGFIAALEAADQTKEVRFKDTPNSPANPHSYRGYYSDLSFENTELPVTVAEFLKILKGCLGQTFEGWKGGDFVMSEDTPLWNSEEGSTGDAIVGYEIGISFDLITKTID